MRYTWILLAGMVLGTAASCNKDDNDDAVCRVTKQVDNNTGVITTVTYKDGKPYRVEQSNGTSGQVTHNSEGRITLYEIFNGNNTKVGYVSFEYTADGKLLEKETYTAGILVDFNLRFRDVYEYTGSNVTKITNYDLDYSPTSINGYTTYEYSGAGNIATESRYGRDGSDNIILISTTSYEYDSANNPAGDLAPYLNLFSENNVTVRNTTIYFPNTDNVVDSIEYIYNEYNYPTKVTTFKDDGGVDSYDVEYSCN